MKKFQKLSKNIAALCITLAAVITVCLIAPPALAAVPERPENRYVLDSAGVLSKATEREIIEENQELFEEYGAEIVVAAVDFLGGKNIADYTYEMFKAWGVGSAERNNGILLVLAIGEDDYYVQAGYGIDDYFDGALLGMYLDEYLEDYFASGDYDQGVLCFFDAIKDEIEDYYEHGNGQDDPMPGGYDGDYNDYDDYEDDHMRWPSLSVNRFVSKIKTIVFAFLRVILVVVVILLLFRLFRGRGSGGGGFGGGSGGSGGGGFFSGMLLGNMLGRGHRRWGTPPPPPPPGGFGPGPGGFGHRPGGFGPGSTGRPGGFHGGGRTHGGGAGRGFGGGFGGGGFRGGGGSHGGGAGRR